MGENISKIIILGRNVFCSLPLESLTLGFKPRKRLSCALILLLLLRVVDVDCTLTGQVTFRSLYRLKMTIISTLHVTLAFLCDFGDAEGEQMSGHFAGISYDFLGEVLLIIRRRVRLFIAFIKSVLLGRQRMLTRLYILNCLHIRLLLYLFVLRNFLQNSYRRHL